MVALTKARPTIDFTSTIAISLTTVTTRTGKTRFMDGVVAFWWLVRLLGNTGIIMGCSWSSERPEGSRSTWFHMCIAKLITLDETFIITRMGVMASWLMMAKSWKKTKIIILLIVCRLNWESVWQVGVIISFATLHMINNSTYTWIYQ